MRWGFLLDVVGVGKSQYRVVPIDYRTGFTRSTINSTTSIEPQIQVRSKKNNLFDRNFSAQG